MLLGADGRLETKQRREQDGGDSGKTGRRGEKADRISVFSGYDTDRGCKKNGNVPGSDFQDGEEDIEEADDS